MLTPMGHANNSKQRRLFYIIYSDNHGALTTQRSAAHEASDENKCFDPRGGYSPATSLGEAGDHVIFVRGFLGLVSDCKFVCDHHTSTS